MKKIKAFTLVEMLLVVVIIWVLMWALIPNLMGTRSLAEDVARISHLRDYDSSLQRYRMDNSSYPVWCYWLSTMSELSDYMKEFPADPNPTYYIPYNTGSTSAYISGDYLYCSLRYRNIPNSAYILLARLSSDKKTNIPAPSETTNTEINWLEYPAFVITGWTTYENLSATIVREWEWTCTSGSANRSCYYAIVRY